MGSVQINQTPSILHFGDPIYWCVAEALTLEKNGGISICVSQYLAQQLRQLLAATNPKVVPCGITLPSTQTCFSDQPFRVLYSGRIAHGGMPEVHS